MVDDAASQFSLSYNAIPEKIQTPPPLTSLVPSTSVIVDAKPSNTLCLQPGLMLLDDDDDSVCFQATINLDSADNDTLFDTTDLDIYFDAPDQVVNVVANEHITKHVHFADDA